MSYIPITGVGIDVSKGKYTVAVKRPRGEGVLKLFDVKHNAAELQKLAPLEGEMYIVMEHTWIYWRRIALALKNAGL